MAELETLLSLANPKLRYMRAEKCNRLHDIAFAHEVGRECSHDPVLSVTYPKLPAWNYAVSNALQSVPEPLRIHRFGHRPGFPQAFEGRFHTYRALLPR